MEDETTKSWLRGWRGLLAAYLILLAASHLWVTAGSGSGAAAPDGQTATVRLQAQAGDTLLPGESVRIAYSDRYRGPADRPPVLLALAGEEGALDRLAEQLSDSMRVILPLLPGQSPSGPEAPDYSLRSWAGYAGQLLDSLGIEGAHVLGQGRGGGAAIRFSRSDSAATRSLVLLSSSGVQELQMLGSYTMNRAVNGFRLGMRWVFRNAVPHFGLLRRSTSPFPLRVNYDSDRRSLRGSLEAFRKPMLIQHGQNDAAVSPVIAREHYRIVPQSVLRTYEGGHAIASTQAEAVAADIARFVRDVERGEATRAAGADSARVTESRQPFENIQFTRFTGLNLLLLMLVIALGTFVSEDLTCIGAGLLAARGLIGFMPATAACFAGIVVGDMGLYLLGRWLGRPAMRRAPLKWMVSEAELERSAEWFHARGPAIIIASRFLPGSRFPTYFSAGVIGAGFWMFTFYFMVAALAWTPMLVGLSMLVGTELLAYFHLYRHYALWVVLGAIGFLVLVVKVVLPAFSYRGRRLLLSRWKRIVNWEFWPPWVLYFPVCCYIAWLGVKHRGLTVFTAANPDIPEGGFIGESKSAILDLFGDRENIVPYRLIEASLDTDERHKRAQEFMREHGLDFPVVLKPDRSERGRGVRIVRGLSELNRRLASAGRDLIIQRYAEGEEFGVFYYRRPGEQEGEIFSITVKEMLQVEGDGASTLEELILEDPRALCLAPRHLEAHKEELYVIPEEGERVPLVEIGTHAMGALFSDGAELITEELRREMDRISRSAEGFNFGRYDLRAPSREALSRGEGLQVIEVNGVTSESTDIYDASNSFFDAQSILMRQWRLVFEIGRAQADRGHRPAGAGRLLKLLFRHLLRRDR